MPFWKKLIYPFVWLAVTILVYFFRLMGWIERELKELPFSWQNIPVRWEIVGVQKNRIFLKEVDNE
ncbi:MAG: hypothetical protein WC276_06605 [Sedimentibacter sp.]